MIALRYTASLAFGGLLTSAMFWLLWHLISQEIPIGDKIVATRIEFSRVKQDTDVTSKRQEKIERERPQQTPELPRMTMASSAVESTVVKLAPTLNVSGAMTKMAMAAGSDRDTLPLVRINPEYPERARARGIEGWVLIQYTITATGTVKDAVVIDAQPKGIFDDTAIKAILRWRFNPRVENGVSVERVGLQTKLAFVLNAER